jgi:class 3 adenylate cyclase
LEDEIKRKQQQTILNLYNSGIIPDVIALQVDVNKEEVINMIKNARLNDKRKEESIKQVSDSWSLGMFYLDSIVNIDLAIKDAQLRTWKALKSKPKFNIPMEQTQNILERLNESKVTLVILHVDLVGSTKLSMILPTERVATIIQAFTQEMFLIVSAYGGYVFKNVGDAVLAFFIVSSDKNNSLNLPCSNAVNCARSMIKIIQQGINPILNEYDYPEMGVRIGIDVGENAVVQYGWAAHAYSIEEDKKQIIKKPYLDVLGYSISIASKMTGFAKPDQIVISQSVYDILDDIQKPNFKELPVKRDDWNYVNPTTSGGIYCLYGSLR